MWDTLIVPRWDVHVISGIQCPMSMIFLDGLMDYFSFTSYFLIYQMVEICFH